MTLFLMGTTSSITMQSLGKIVQSAPAVGAKMWCLPAGCREAAIAGIVFIHRPKIRFFAPQGRLVAPIQVKLAVPTGTSVRLAVQNFTSIGADGWECGPQNIKNFHFLVKSRLAGATPLTDFEIFWGLLYA